MTDAWLEAIAAADAADWVTVAFYLVAAYLARKAASVARLPDRTRERSFWRLTAVLMVLLGINELLDLQTLLTGIGRAYAKADGWYEQRREFQHMFILALAAVTAIIGVVAIMFTWRMARSVQVALLGIVFIGFFVLLRAASIHHFSDIMGRGHPVFNLGALQELLGIFIVAGAAVFYGRGHRADRVD